MEFLCSYRISLGDVSTAPYLVLQSFEQFMFFMKTASLLNGASSPSVIHLPST